jgi:hypothetical protein
MKVYIVTRFADYESDQILKVFDSKEKAKYLCEKTIFEIKSTWYPDEEIEKLPTGYRIGDIGVCFTEMEVE